MSVINQMLRDLDARQQAGQAGVSADPALRNIRRDTVSVAELSAARNQARAPRRMLLGLSLLGALAMVVGVGWLFKERLPQAVIAGAASRNELAPTIAPSAAALPASRTGAGAAVAPPVAPLQAPPLSAAPMSNAAPNVSAQVAVRVKQVVAPTAPALPAVVASSPPRDLPSARSAAAPASAAPPAASMAVPAQREPAPAQPGRAQAATEVMAHAQSLWDQGSRDAALQLLRDALAVLERSAVAGESGTLLAQAVREIVRMELAQGHPVAALDLLQRLEPQLANQADVWALRGNVAQRLGRHAESVQAYLSALKLRPGEARWMLGAAVSLAAQGQTAQATELAEQARQRGGLSPEVESYLRQQGVVLR